MAEKSSVKLIAQNKKAYHDYFILETIEAGVELKGTEVKSIRLGKVNLKDSYAEVKNGQMHALGVHVSPYEKGNIFNTDPLRPKRLLLHKREIMRLYGKVMQEGFTLVPLKVYLKGPLVKIELGLCKGKKIYDKREDAARRSAQREIEKSLKERNYY